MSKLIVWIKSHKLLSYGIGVLIVLVIIISSSSGSTKPKTTNLVQPTHKSSQPQKAPAQAADTTPKIPYQIVSSHDTGSQLTAVYLIDPSHDNVADLTILGKQLSQVAASTKGYFNGDVFDDATAASYIDAVHSFTDTPAQDAVYDPHYIGVYTKNPSSHLNRFVIQVKGDQDANPQFINY